MASYGNLPLVNISSGTDELFAVSHGEEHIWGFHPEDVTTWTPAFKDQNSNFIQTGTVVIANPNGNDTLIQGTRIVTVSSASLTDQTSTEGIQGIDVNGDGDMGDAITRTRTRYSASVEVGSDITDTHIIFGNWTILEDNDFDASTVTSWTPVFVNQVNDFTQLGVDTNGISGGRVVSVNGTALANEQSTEAAIDRDVNNDGDKADDIERTVTRYAASVTIGSAISNTHNVLGDWFVTTDVSFNASTVTTWAPLFSTQIEDFSQTGTDGNSITGSRTVTVTPTSLTNESSTEATIDADINGDGDKTDDIERTRTRYSAGVTEGSSISNTHTVLGPWFVTNDVDFTPSLVTTWSPLFAAQIADFTQSGTDTNGLAGQRVVTVSSTALANEQSTEAAIDVDVNNDGDKTDDIERTVTRYSATVSVGSDISNTHTINGDWFVVSDIDFNPSLVPSWTPIFTNQTSDFTQEGTDTNSLTGEREVTVTSSAQPNDKSTEAALNDDVDNDGDLFDLVERTRVRYSAEVSVGSSIDNTFDVVGDWFVSLDRDFNPSTVNTWSPSFTNQTSDFNQNGTDGAGLPGTRLVSVLGTDQANDTSNEATIDVDVNNDGDKFDDIQRTRVRYSAGVTVGAAVPNTHDVVGDWFVSNNITETFGDWSPDFETQTSDFVQSRTGTQGTIQERTIIITPSSEPESSTENAIGTDVNNDGDTFDDVTRTNTRYTASNGLGNHLVLGSWSVSTDVTEIFSDDWTPEFEAQTSDFTQSRTGTQGTVQTRDVDVVSTIENQDSTEAIQDIDVNNDGDKIDEIRRSRTRYTANHGLGNWVTDYGSWSVTTNNTETFTNAWTPAFSNQTSNFEQSRTGNFGTVQKRTITVTPTPEPQSGFEGSSALASTVGTTAIVYNVGDVNGDGDIIDSLTRSRTRYTANHGLGSHATAYGAWSVTTNRTETFGDWSPEFDAQITDFEQSRTGNFGTVQTRDINVSFTDNIESSTEADEGVDVNNDGDLIDDIERTNRTYLTNPNIGFRTDSGPWSVTTNRTPVTLFATVTGPMNPEGTANWGVTVTGNATGPITYEWDIAPEANFSPGLPDLSTFFAGYSGTGAGSSFVVTVTITRQGREATGTLNGYMTAGDGPGGIGDPV